MTLAEITTSLREIHARLVRITKPPHTNIDRFYLEAEVITLGQRVTALEQPLEVGDDQGHFICLCPDCCVKPPPLQVGFHLNATGSVAVADGIYWQPMKTCPRGADVFLLNPGGFATRGAYDGKDPQWRGWFPLPKIPKEGL